MTSTINICRNTVEWAIHDPQINACQNLRNMSLSISSPKVAHPSTYCRYKRLLDIIGSVMGLAILAVVFLPVAIAIKLDSPGTIFYSQTRYGLYGKPFKIWKFRSMIENAEALKSQIPNQAKGFIFKNKNDPRITRVGKFLRQTSLDEFPQFWNVLLGDMSLVGTRPPSTDEVIKYSPYHWQRLNVKPGITGEWQVNGRSGVKDFDAVVELDLRYQTKWTCWQDLVILVKTVYVVVAKIGAC